MLFFFYFFFHSFIVFPVLTHFSINPSFIHPSTINPSVKLFSTVYQSTTDLNETFEFNEKYNNKTINKKNNSDSYDENVYKISYNIVTNNKSDGNDGANEVKLQNKRRREHDFVNIDNHDTLNNTHRNNASPTQETTPPLQIFSSSFFISSSSSFSSSLLPVSPSASSVSSSFSVKSLSSHSASSKSNSFTFFFSSSSSSSFSFSSSSFFSSSSSSSSSLNSRLLWLFIGPVIFVIGLCGNVFVLLIMSNKAMAGTSTSIHLSTMAAADLSVMVVGLVPEWFENCFKMVFKDLHPITCKLEKFLFYCSADVSVWVLVAFSIDRYVAIRHPLKRVFLCTRSRAIFLSIFISMAAITKNLHVFWTRGVQYTKNGGELVVKKFCGVSHASYWSFEDMVRPWLVLLLVNFLPAILIVVCNIFIVKEMFKIKNSSRVSHRFVAASLLKHLNNNNNNNNNKMETNENNKLSSFRRRHSADVVTLEKRNVMAHRKSLMDTKLLMQAQVPSVSRRAITQMCAMCISASICFMVCNTPSVLLYVLRRHLKHHPVYQVSKPICNFLVYVNHSINFLLYCVTGNRFRSLFLTYFRCVNNEDPPSKRRYSDWNEGGVLTSYNKQNLKQKLHSICEL